MKKRIFKASRLRFVRLLALAGLALPASAFAQQTSMRFDTLVTKIIGYMNGAAQVLIGAGVVLIAYGIVKYIGAGEDTKRLAEGGRMVLWGVITVFVMVSIWGIINIFLNSFFSQSSLTGFQLSNQLFSG